MKDTVLNNLDKYVVKDERIKQLLLQIKESGKQSFLLTNSDYAYTNGVMEYLIGKDWTSYFNITVVNAHKPKWFAEGTVFREVNTETGALKIGIHTGPLKQGEVYSGGSCDAFRRLVKARGKDVLYIGDHIFGDVLRSKKARGWRTFLVVPELTQELTVWTERKPLFKQIHTEFKSSLSNEMDSEYEVDHERPSLRRSTSKTISKVERYADVYASIGRSRLKSGQ
uniref:Uncharacterized protein n=1 Tax=Parascaris equorum TaxID=6256 RepID=A0A914S432_PAREQ